MTGKPYRSTPSSNGASQNSTQGLLTEADVRVTAVLASRPARQPDLAADIQALQLLAQQLMEDPQTMLKTLVEIVLNRTQAGTAGVSLLETAPNGESVFRWVAVAGAFADLEQTIIPGDFSPCATTLRSNQPQLYAHPERYFTYLHHPHLQIVEELLIPLQVNRQPLGMLWIVSHEEARQFDSEDQRLMMSLGGFTASALQSMQQLHQKAEDAQREQARAAAALRESQEWNQQILDSSDDCIKVLDLEGRILFMSSGGQALLGIQDITPFLNTSWAEFWEGAAQQSAIAAISGARAGKVCTFQGYRPTLTGKPKWWDSKISPIRRADGQVERLLCISRDITDRKRSEDQRKQAEERLRESEEQLSAIFSQATVGLSELSLDGHFQRVNDELCRILGRSREEMLAIDVPDATYPEDVPKSLEAFRTLVQTGELVSFDKRYLRPDGTIVWANSSLTRLDDPQGQPRTVLAVSVDLSERKRAEEISRRAAELNAFRVSLTDVIRPLADPVEVQATASRVLGQYLGANRVAYFELCGGDYVIERDYVNGVTTMAGGYPMESFGPKLLAAYRTGQTVSTSDVTADSNLSPDQRAAYAASQIGAYIGIPLVKGGEFVAGLAVHTAGPRTWTPDEVALAEEVAERTWAAVERARAEAALRESETKYRSLFESIDEGFCIVEMLFVSRQLHWLI